jgi:hypothetical protein
MLFKKRIDMQNQMDNGYRGAVRVAAAVGALTGK